MVEVFYDGDCAFCVRSLLPLRRLASDGLLIFSDFTVDANALRLKKAVGAGMDISKAMWSIDGHGVAHSGYEAFRVSLLAVPKMRWVAFVMNVPFVRLIGRRLYRTIASRRRELGWLIGVRP
jgi:predicted DCC family thiol-disulfide oxidoreductase YuxK